MARKRKTTRLVELRNQAKRQGWSRWIRQGEGEESDEQAMLNGCWFVPQRGEHAIEFMEHHCRLHDPGPYYGEPIKFLDWQREFLMRLFGWVRWSEDWQRIVRRFRWCYLELPKKNGKSPLMAAIGCYLLFGDGNQSTRVFSTATTKKQASIVHLNAAGMVEASPELSAVARIRKEDGYKRIEYPGLGSIWGVAAADARSADGYNGHLLCDELHRWDDWQFWQTLQWMLAAQPEGLMFMITTAGQGMDTICRTQRERAGEVNSGRRQDERFYGLVFAADPQDDPHDEETWKRTNPSLGHIVKLSDFRADYHDARTDPTKWKAWLRLRLGVWQSAESAWLDEIGGLDRWDAGAAARQKSRRRKTRLDCWDNFTIQRFIDDQTPCWFGLDGATHHDTTAAVFIFPDGTEDEVIRILPYFWLPEAKAQQLGPKVPYREWAEEGFITLTPGDACDYGVVKRDILELCGKLNVRGFAFDPLFQAEWLTQQIDEEADVPRIAFRQTITTFSPPMKTLGRLITQKKALHNGHPLFTWQLSHLRAYEDCNQNQRPVKQKTGDHRTIDGPVAAIMGLSLAVANEDNQPTWYDHDEHEVEFY
jgi:phage terminase large subunit-like protein